MILKKLIIIGAAEPGQEIVDIIRNGCLQKDLEFYKYFDDNIRRDDTINTLDEAVYGYAFVSSLGNVQVRERLFQRFVQHQLIPASVIAAASWISPSAQISDGAVIYPFCSISSNVRIAENVLINFHTSVSHGVHIGANSNLCPGARIAGNVSLGKNVYIGIGSVVKEKISICDNVLIGANSTVIRNIDEPGVYAGSPCQLIRNYVNE
jgi:UDP-N-acetylbacillosamine N-acetyltransferase